MRRVGHFSERRAAVSAAPAARSEAELVAQPAEATSAARELQQLARIEAELRQQALVALRVHLVRQLLLRLLRLVVLAALAQQLQDLVLGDLHGRGLPRRPSVYPRTVIATTLRCRIAIAAGTS